MSQRELDHIASSRAQSKVIKRKTKSRSSCGCIKLASAYLKCS